MDLKEYIGEATASWEILKVISKCRHISAEQIGRMLGLSASGVRYHIRALTSKSLIRRIGSFKTGHWEVVKWGTQPAGKVVGQFEEGNGKGKSESIFALE